MGLNPVKGNMYDFVTHTFNTVKGQCEHDCIYCYMKRFKNLKPVRFDAKELKTDLGSGNVIFVGSSNDMFANGISELWIARTLEHCKRFDNTYLFQSKNPKRLLDFKFPKKVILGTTIETNRESGLSIAPKPSLRAFQMGCLSIEHVTMITIEPICDFDLDEFVGMLKRARPHWVNIGADSGGNNLPEPSKEKVLALIEELKKFTEVRNKTNLKRLL